MFVNLHKTFVVICSTALVACNGIPLGNDALAAPAQSPGTLTVMLKGVQAGGGPLYVSVQKREDFKKDAGSAGGIYKNVSGGNLSYSYSGVAEGEYAIMIWHDIDNDGEFSKDPVTYMPLDGWGASGKELRGEPEFDDVKVLIPTQGKTVTIQMRYVK